MLKFASKAYRLGLIRELVMVQNQDANELKQRTADVDAPQSARAHYLPPSVKIDKLVLITRGGTVGEGDSGAQGTELPPGVV